MTDSTPTNELVRFDEQRLQKLKVILGSIIIVSMVGIAYFDSSWPVGYVAVGVATTAWILMFVPEL